MGAAEERMVDYASTLEFRELPTEVVRHAKRRVIDTLGAALAAYSAPPAQIARKLALPVAYAFIGVIGAEFIMSRTDLGYEINFAYNNFDNAVMYPLILLILLLATTSNMALHYWEKILLRRRARS